MADSGEEILWEGHPSQWTNFPLYFICTLTGVLIIPIFIGVWRWIVTACHRYKVTSERIQITTGVFSKVSEELELYRVKDLTLLQPFWLRLVSRAHLLLTSSDRTHPRLQLTGIPDAEALREALRRHVERLRTEKGLREMDVE